MQFTSGENIPQWGKTLSFNGLNIVPHFQLFYQVPSEIEKGEQKKNEWSITSVGSHLGWQIPSHVADNLFPATATQDRNGVFSHLDALICLEVFKKFFKLFPDTYLSYPNFKSHGKASYQ